MPETKTITLIRDKDCKHSVRFAAPKETVDPVVVGSVYVNRPFASGALRIDVTITIP